MMRRRRFACVGVEVDTGSSNVEANCLKRDANHGRSYLSLLINASNKESTSRETK